MRIGARNTRCKNATSRAKNHCISAFWPGVCIGGKGGGLLHKNFLLIHHCPPPGESGRFFGLRPGSAPNPFLQTASANPPPPFCLTQRRANTWGPKITAPQAQTCAVMVHEGKRRLQKPKPMMCDPCHPDNSAVSLLLISSPPAPNTRKKFTVERVSFRQKSAETGLNPPTHPPTHPPTPAHPPQGGWGLGLWATKRLLRSPHARPLAPSALG